MGTRNEPDDYAKAEFIKAVKGNLIDFNYSGKNQKLFDDVTIQDARWIASWLGRLSDEQLKDAFRAANHSPEEVEQLAVALRARINALARVSPGMATR